jgi:hypothetical protein
VKRNGRHGTQGPLREEFGGDYEVNVLRQEVWALWSFMFSETGSWRDTRSMCFVVVGCIAHDSQGGRLRGLRCSSFLIREFWILRIMSP